MMDFHPGRSFGFLFLFFSFLYELMLSQILISNSCESLNGDYLQKGEESDWPLHNFPPGHGLSHVGKTNDQNLLCT